MSAVRELLPIVATGTITTDDGRVLPMVKVELPERLRGLERGTYRVRIIPTIEPGWLVVIVVVGHSIEARFGIPPSVVEELELEGDGELAMAFGDDDADLEYWRVWWSA